MSEIGAILPGVEEGHNTPPPSPPEKKQKIEGANGSDEMETSKLEEEEDEDSEEEEEDEDSEEEDDDSEEEEEDEDSEEEDDDSEEEEEEDCQKRRGRLQFRRRPPTEWWKEYEGLIPEETLNNIKLFGTNDLDPDSDYIPDGAKENKVDWDLWKLYYKQIEDTEGFGVKVFPGSCFNAFLRPVFNFKDSPLFNRYANELSDMAIKHFNTGNGKEFRLADVEWMVEQPSRGLMFLLTFTAEDPKEGLKTFEAKVLKGINNEREVFLCRIKKQEAVP